jgi:hypothetical protein
MNLYSYGHNSPTRFVDRRGLQFAGEPLLSEDGSCAMEIIYDAVLDASYAAGPERTREFCLGISGMALGGYGALGESVVLGELSLVPFIGGCMKVQDSLVSPTPTESIDKMPDSLPTLATDVFFHSPKLTLTVKVVEDIVEIGHGSGLERFAASLKLGNDIAESQEGSDKCEKCGH